MEEVLQSNEGLSKEQEGILEIGIQHEQQHQELLLYDIKYILGSDQFQPPYFETPSPAKGGNGSESPSEEWLEIPEGIYTIGHDGNGFAYDNEYGRHNVYLHRARLLDRLVTNGEWIEFMESGGYDDPDLWLDEGWTWIKENHITAPLYWFMYGGSFYTYTLHGMEEVDPSEPVTHISYYEAQAFAHWKGKRLPTEAEWEVLCDRLHDEIPEDANLQEKMQGRPLPKNGEHFQFFGDCWEWTQSAYLPYPFYKREPGAMGEYNGKFMCGQMVLRGGSCATPRSHIRSTYRNFFHPPERWLFNGLRLAETLE
jgi:ergothioneine biosynthesis protein EgtB